jgi:hypothetical protein
MGVCVRVCVCVALSSLSCYNFVILICNGIFTFLRVATGVYPTPRGARPRSLY